MFKTSITTTVKNTLSMNKDHWVTSLLLIELSKVITQPTLNHHILVTEAMISTLCGKLISPWAHPRQLTTRCGSFKIQMSQELPPNFMPCNKLLEEMFNLVPQLQEPSLPKTTASIVFNGLNWWLMSVECGSSSPNWCPWAPSWWTLTTRLLTLN